MAARTQLAFRTLKGIGIIEGSPIYEPLSGFERPEGNIRCCVYSLCGRYFAWASPDKVQVVDASSGGVLTVLPAQNVFDLGFSPSGTFIITWQRPSKDENGDAVKNLKVWRTVEDSPGLREDERSVVGRFVQKSATGWNLQYTHDEQFCARVVTNEIQFYKSVDLSTVMNKLHAEGVIDSAISPGKNQSIAIFVPERKGFPAAVKIFDVPNFEAPKSQKTFFKGDKVQLKWNNDGTSLIVLAQTEVDKSGKSYYGETTLYLMSGSGGFDSRIDLDKDGPIHDVTWSPNSKEFGVVYGYMPAKTTLFNTKANAIHTFPLSPRNTIQFSPHSKFLLVAGFGNLAGQLDIYDLEKDYAKVCTIEASNASVCEWSPDGKHILTATTSPRLRVDNGVKIWHFGGGLMYNKDLQELYHVTWRPQSTMQHPLKNSLQLMHAPHESALKYLGNIKTPSKAAGAYRPPGARGQVTPLAFRREDEGGAAYVSNGQLSQGINLSGFGKPRKREIPGAETADNPQKTSDTVGGDDESLSKAAAKNKKKREAKKAKEMLERPRDLSKAKPDHSPNRGREESERNGSRERGDTQLHLEQRSPHLNPTERSAIATQSLKTRLANDDPTQCSQKEMIDVTLSSPGSGGNMHEKKVRALLKKLRAIDDLKMRRAGGERLEGTQIKKMDTEDAVRRELEELGWSDV